MASVLTIQKVQSTNARAWQDDIKVTYLQKHHIVPKHPFRLVTSGSSGTGKTNTIVHMLTKKEIYYKFFDEIHIVCPSVSDSNYEVLDEMYQDSEVTEIFKYEALDETAILKLAEILTEGRREAKEKKHETTKRLIILDDVISDKNIMRKEVRDLFFSGRHASISVIVTAQSYMKVPRDCRLNATNYFLYGLLRNESEIKRVVEEHRRSFISPAQFEEIILDASKPDEKHVKPFLHINYQGDELECYRKGLDEKYEVSYNQNKDVDLKL